MYLCQRLTISEDRMHETEYCEHWFTLMSKLENSRRTWSWIWGTRAKPFSTKNQDITQILPSTSTSPGRGSVVRWQSFIPRQVQPRVETRDTWHVLLPTRTWSASSVTADQTKGLRLWNIFTVLFFFINLYWVLVDLRYIYVDFWSVGFMRGSDQIHFFNTWIYSRLDWSPSMSPN